MHSDEHGKHSLKVKGTAFILRDGKVIAKTNNHMLINGARLIMSYLQNTMVADGYGAAALRPDYIHYGHGDKALDKEDYHLEDFTGSLQISVVGRTTWVNDYTVDFEVDLPAAGDMYISEAALACGAGDPASAVDYANTVVDRVIFVPTHIKPDGTATDTIRIRIELQLT